MPFKSVFENFDRLLNTLKYIVRILYFLILRLMMAHSRVQDNIEFHMWKGIEEYKKLSDEEHPEMTVK